MIATLYSQEFRTTRKAILPTIGIMLAVIVASLAVAALRVPILGELGLGLAIAGTLALTPVVLALLVAHYWRTMYGAQGYFTMTLPTRGRTIFAVKVLYGITAALVALVVSAGLLALAAMAFALSQGLGAFDFLREGLETLPPAVGWAVGAALVFLIVFAVIAGATAMSVGARGPFNHLGFGAPVLFMVVLYFAMQLLSLAAMLVIPLGVQLTGPEAGAVVGKSMLGEFVAAIKDPAVEPSVLGLGMIPVYVIVMVVLAWWGARSVDKHTSLR